jgi:hypothetical protein
MEAPKTLTEARATLKAHQEQMDALRAELVAANELLAEAQSAAQGIDLLRNENAVLLAEKMALEAKNLELNEAAKSAELRVTEAMASLGVPPVAIAPEPVAPKSKADLWAEYNKLPIENRHAFYLANRNALRD